jgi:uncharacterized protein
MVLLLFRNASQRLLLTLGLVLILAPPLLAGLVEAVTGAPLPNLAGIAPADVEAGFTAMAPAYTTGDYWAFMAANLRYYAFHNAAETGYVVMYNLGVLGLFMLGLWSSREGLFEDIERHRPLLRRLVWIALPVGLAFSAIHATRRLGIPADGVFYGVVTAAYVGLPIMAFGYLSILALYISHKGRWLSTLLAPMGRMALTGYLASNAIGGFVWYAWGLNKIGDAAWLTMAGMNLFSIAVFVALCVFSAVWLRYFRFGPAEWVWRSFTYGRLQPLQKRAPAV